MTTSPKDQRLYAEAERLEVVVTEGEINGPDNARWYPDARCIVLRIGLRADVRRCCLGHELGHIVHGHGPGCDPDTYARQERAADEYAARLLISHDDYRLAEMLYGPNTLAIALHLEVTEALVRTWQHIERRRIETDPANLSWMN
ncbi:ImmA/IrrE family metallo-endopeptidase [Prescottella equi]